jgi:hypothetical protein
MGNTIEKEQFKNFTDDVKKVLVYAVSRENPKKNFTKLENTFKAYMNIDDPDDSYIDGVLDYMKSFRLFEHSNNKLYLELSALGVNIGQDIALSPFWEEAVNICESRDLYSLDAVIMAVRKLAAQAISEAVSNK